MASLAADLGREPPRPPFREVELRDLIGMSNRASPAPRWIKPPVVAWGGFWLFPDGEQPVKIVHTDLRKERKF